MKLINSYRAHRQYIKAHGMMGGQFQSLALLAIRKAVEIEPEENKLPQYLELQGQIELSLGKKERALESFKQARKILKKYLVLSNNNKRKKLANRMDEAITNLKKEQI